MKKIYASHIEILCKQGFKSLISGNLRRPLTFDEEGTEYEVRDNEQLHMCKKLSSLDTANVCKY